MRSVPRWKEGLKFIGKYMLKVAKKKADEARVLSF